MHGVLQYLWEGSLQKRGAVARSKTNGDTSTSEFFNVRKLFILKKKIIHQAKLYFY